MALRVDHQDAETGALYDDAYFQIDPLTIMFDFVKESVIFDVQVFVSERAKQQGKRRLAVLRKVVTGDEFRAFFSGPITARGYAYLRTLDLFRTAEDA